MVDSLVAEFDRLKVAIDTIKRQIEALPRVVAEMIAAQKS
jgi:hypothetical protein